MTDEKVFALMLWILVSGLLVLIGGKTAAHILVWVGGIGLAAAVIFVMIALIVIEGPGTGRDYS